ncbi:hypothetical protein ASF48_10640 [Rathayibacter sp. Leaf299]|uniref:hypothetical protein n=1 Tax=unclassified Rathayibacter TaxID=2609250 RepID=UPI0007161542|nr:MULTISPECIES: hypothetical protein [unclassified Rathayibacter]KQQ21000.1 hypothetical protein ASF48_10640 [Rathayibacter sp. Leaf299]
MQRTVGGVVITVTHTKTDHARRTTSGPIQLRSLTLSGPGIDCSATIGVAGRSTEADDDVFATLVDVALLQYVSAGADGDPLAAPEVSEWKRIHDSELRLLVSRLRGEGRQRE